MNIIFYKGKKNIEPFKALYACVAFMDSEGVIKIDLIKGGQIIIQLDKPTIRQIQEILTEIHAKNAGGRGKE